MVRIAETPYLILKAGPQHIMSFQTKVAGNDAKVLLDSGASQAHEGNSGPTKVLMLKKNKNVTLCHNTEDKQVSHTSVAA